MMPSVTASFVPFPFVLVTVDALDVRSRTHERTLAPTPSL
jgi:hypothetical protein|tara:strand:- start:408 stop:527 length:120 start_codon:yes stop_codon:yes gene_type:complete